YGVCSPSQEAKDSELETVLEAASEISLIPGGHAPIAIEAEFLDPVQERRLQQGLRPVLADVVVAQVEYAQPLQVRTDRQHPGPAVAQVVAGQFQRPQGGQARSTDQGRG